MADLSFLYENGTVDAIDAHYEAIRVERAHLGLSQAGHDCKRFLWYTHNGYAQKPIDGRVLRLFRMGDIIEELIVGDLVNCGIKVWGQQEDVMFTWNGVELRGHADGIASGFIESPKIPHLLECKSANKTQFSALKKLGAYTRWKPIYHWQIQFYMLGLKLTRAAVFVLCKDNSELYMERIHLDKELAVNRLRTVFEAITAPTAPARMCPRADYYLAKFCGHCDRCWGNPRDNFKYDQWFTNP